MIDINLYAWVVRGKQRTAILKAFTHAMTPSQLHKKSKHYNEKISLNNCSDIVRSFAKQGLAECKNKEAKTGRIYELTEEGEIIRNELLKDYD